MLFLNVCYLECLLKNLIKFRQQQMMILNMGDVKLWDL